MISANELETFLNNCQFYFSKWWLCNFQTWHDHPLEKNCQIKVWQVKCKFLSMYYLGNQNSTIYFFSRVNFHKKREQKKCDFFPLSFFILFYLVKKKSQIERTCSFFPSNQRAPRIFNKRAPDSNLLLPLFSLQSSPYDTYHATLR